MDDRSLRGHGFGEEHFAAAQLGDRRRTRRLVQLADAVVRHPGGTLPDKVNHPATLKALYRLMDCEAVTHESVLTPSRERTLERISEAEGTVLVIHDATELDYSGLKSLEGLGHIGNGHNRGYVAHNTLAVVAETRDVIGLVYQKLAKRPQVTKKETRAQRRARPDRESRLWKQASQTVPAAAPGRRQVEVADRGADLLEFMDYVEGSGKSYLVRSKHNRRICLENGLKTQLHDFARQRPAGGHKTVDVPAGKNQPARTTTASIAWAQVTLLIPAQPRGEIRGIPLTTWVVCVREVNPPAGAQAVEWILLTNVPVNNLDDAQERIAWYECRWMIEEYHKALKTGCGIETLQFTTEQRLKPAIAFVSVVALFLLNLRNASRRPDAHERPATQIVPVAYVVALSIWRYKQPREDLTVHEFYYALARMGGHQNRKQDHPPGWLVLWRGWTKLQPMIEATLALGWKRCG
jgi:hypothetical protein